MRARWVALLVTLATPLAGVAIFQGLVTAGLAPLAVFAPVYVLVQSLAFSRGEARAEASRVTVAASAVAGLALLPASTLVDPPSVPVWATTGLGVVAAGAGGLAAIACAPSPHEVGPRGRQRWAFVEAMETHHARGLALLAGVAVPAGALVALLREAPIVAVGDQARRLPDALFGSLAVDGALVLPDPASTVAIAVPLSLAPLALGFLTSPKRAGPLALGGLAVAALSPVAMRLDVPVQAPSGAWVPITVLDRPGLAVVDALAPAAVGLLVGAAGLYAVRQAHPNPVAVRGLWAIGAALGTALLAGIAAGLVVTVCVVAAGLVVAVATDRAPFGLAIALGGLAGGVGELLGGLPVGVALGGFVGVAGASAAATYAATRSLDVTGEHLRSPWTLVYVLAGVIGVGGLYALVGPGLSAGAYPFGTPHAEALGSALSAVVEGRGLFLVGWGLVAGAVVQVAVGVGAWVALGLLVGPGVAVLVLAGSLLRAAWEKGLLDRAREGYVMRGQLGYQLLRVHVLVVSVLAGEALAVGIAAVMPG